MTSIEGWTYHIKKMEERTRHFYAWKNFFVYDLRTLYGRAYIIHSTSIFQDEQMCNWDFISFDHLPVYQINSRKAIALLRRQDYVQELNFVLKKEKIFWCNGGENSLACSTLVQWWLFPFLLQYLLLNEIFWFVCRMESVSFLLIGLQLVFWFRCFHSFQYLNFYLQFIIRSFPILFWIYLLVCLFLVSIRWFS